jgi:hypothetical protein
MRLGSAFHANSIRGALLAALSLLAATGLAAQPTMPPPAAQNRNSPPANLATAQPAAQSGTGAPAGVSTGASVTPPAPPPAPNWPANDRPSDASVTWDSHGLRVVAANSSLSQIMKAISTQTGATLEGMNKDERIFGVYGPGPARDVITELLDGSGYNVLMIGDQGQGTPRQIVLTAQSPAGAQPAGANNQSAAAQAQEEAEAEQEAQPEPPPQEQPQAQSGAGAPGAPAVPVRSQQEMIQQLQQRQQQVQQQQQQQPNQQ